MEAMDSQDVQVFEDPGLKRALHRCYAEERAPSRLCDRIRQMMRSEAEMSGGSGASVVEMKPVAMGMTPAQRVVAEVAAKRGLTIGAAWPGFAVAAMFAVAVGTIIIRYSGQSPLGTSPAALASALPTDFQQAAIAIHDHCCQSASHQGKDVPQAPYPAIGSYLRNQLNHPVLAANLEKDHWRFKGAAICPVNGIKAAHLVFLRDNGESLSVFSLPASALPDLKPNETVGEVSEGHAIVARSQDGAVYCLVGHSTDGQLKERDLDNVLAAHLGEASVAVGTAGQKTGRATVAGAAWVGRER